MQNSDSSTQQVNRSVYLDDEGINLMHPDCFTVHVRNFHDLEKLFYFDLLKTKQYRLMIEVGCSDFRLINVKPSNSDYLGVDINPPKRKRFPEQNGALIQCNANKFFDRISLLNEIMEKYDGKVLCILPFNFLGTMDAPLEFLKRVCGAPFDLALSLFGTSEMATKARVEYYRLCGISVKDIVQTSDYVRLDCTNSFQAFAFEPEFLKRLIQVEGFQICEIENHDICNFLHFDKLRSCV